MVIELPYPPNGLMDSIPGGHWVALSMDEQSILANALTAEELDAKLQALGVTEYVLDRALPKDAVLAL